MYVFDSYLFYLITYGLGCLIMYTLAAFRLISYMTDRYCLDTFQSLLEKGIKHTISPLVTTIAV